MESNLLHTAEIVHWVALGVMGVVYTVRLFWLLHFKAGKDRQAPGDRGRTDLGPAMYSMLNVAMPWAMESTRKTKGLFFWITFVLFHIGVVAGIALAVFSSLAPAFFQNPTVAQVFMGFLGIASLIGFVRILRRIFKPVLRLISTPDDYFSVTILTGWFFTGVLAQAHMAGFLNNENYLIVFLFATSFFLIYVPFSKISHYLYYPFIRYYIGKTLGHRGSLAASR